MLNKFKDKFKQFEKDRIYYLDSEDNFKTFSMLYTNVRKKEGRFYDDETLIKLPDVSRDHFLYNEWKMRENSFKILKKYLEKRKDIINILDLGCGNGWMSNKLSEINGKNIFAMDINNEELTQAAEVFQKDTLSFIHADVFNLDISFFQFDCIIISGVLSYFPNPEKLIRKCLNLLNSNGELHLVDNLFYTDEELNKAKQRSKIYYEKLGYPEMNNHFFHHNISLLNSFSFSIVHKPNRILNKARKIIKGSINSPAIWYCIKK